MSLNNENEKRIADIRMAKKCYDKTVSRVISELGFNDEGAYYITEYIDKEEQENGEFKQALGILRSATKDELRKADSLD